MARSDLLISLVRSATKGDMVLFKRTLEALIAEERQKQHHILADRLSEYLKTNGNGEPKGPIVSDDKVQSLVFETIPKKTLDDLVLPATTLKACLEAVEEHNRQDLLRSYGLEPRHRILLIGPPGNGKTSLAEALANHLMLPFLVVRYDGIIGSYLGETANRLRRLFDYVRSRHCVLFFDEFETLGKERGDLHETGEIKRVVSSLLLQIDSLPSHVVVITATNHPELLDKAVWRRFQLRLDLPSPNEEDLEQWFERFKEHLGEPLGVSSSKLAQELKGLSFAEAEEFGNDVIRQRVLSLPGGDLKHIVTERMKQWEARIGPENNRG